jgi:prepilin-type N-terminal cleavage/methylation domain-containing protein
MNTDDNLDRSGFTLIELLVGVVLTAVVSLGVISISMLLFSSSARVKQQDVLEQTKYNLQNELSSSVRWATSVTISIDGNEFTASQSDGTSVVYTFDAANNRILKNGTDITPEDVKVTSMIITNKSLNSNLVSLDIELSMQQKSFAAVQNTARIVVSQRQVTINVH